MDRGLPFDWGLMTVSSSCQQQRLYLSPHPYWLWGSSILLSSVISEVL